MKATGFSLSYSAAKEWWAEAKVVPPANAATSTYFAAVSTLDSHFTAAVVELSVDASGGINPSHRASDRQRLHRERDNAVAPLQGATVWALSAAM